MAAAIVIMIAIIPLASIADSSCEQVDFDENGEIDDVDVLVFKTLIGKSTGDDGFLAEADLDGSGVITPLDFRILLSCR